MPPHVLCHGQLCQPGKETGCPRERALPFGACWFPLAVCGCQSCRAVGLQEPFQHESLLIDRKEHKLTKAEKKAAKKSYEEEKRASVPYTRPSYAQYYPASDQSLTSIPAFSQRNW